MSASETAGRAETNPKRMRKPIQTDVPDSPPSDQTAPANGIAAANGALAAAAQDGLVQGAKNPPEAELL
jgi:hypothetical protein